MKRRALLAATCAAPLAMHAMAAPALPLAQSLQAELAAALGASRPLLVMVSLHGCVYCRIVREHYLLPRLAEGQPMVQVDMHSAVPLADVRGRRGTHDDVVRSWQVRIAPTLLFLGRGGAEAAPRLEGVANLDFYDALLGQRLEQARAHASGAGR